MVGKGDTSVLTTVLWLVVYPATQVLFHLFFLAHLKASRDRHWNLTVLHFVVPTLVNLV